MRIGFNITKGEQRGRIIMIKTTHTLPHMHTHTCSQQRILLREINKQFDWHDQSEAAEKEVSRSFLCLWFVVSQSVMPVELFVYLAEQNALL